MSLRNKTIFRTVLAVAAAGTLSTIAAPAFAADDTGVEGQQRQIVKVSGVAENYLPEAVTNHRGNTKSLVATALEPAANDPSTEAVEEDLAVLTKPLSTIEFNTTGVTWSAKTSVPVKEASIRVRENGQWSEWNSMEILPTAPGSDRTGTEPLVTSGADAVQVRVLTEDGKAPEGLEIVTIDPGTSDKDGAGASDKTTVIEAPTKATGVGKFSAMANLQIQTSTTNADALKPKIITRAQWGANESWSTASAKNSSLKSLYIHHTAGTNNYTSTSQAYQQIRGIYDYHTRSLKWGDIGYHFLIDKFGNIYEGRKGSITSLPLGTHAGGFNTDTMGISAMGNYDVAKPSPAMMNSIKQVLAWKGKQYNLNVKGTTTLTSRGAAGSTAKYSYGTKVTVPVIAGHRNTNATACPGIYIWSQMDQIRNEVSQRMNASSVVAPPTTVTKPSTSTTVTAPKPTHVTTTALNVRKGVGTHYAVIRTLPKGTGVVLTGQKSGGWVAVRVGTTTGWVSASYLTPIKTTTSTTTVAKPSTSTSNVYTTTTSVNMRAGAGTGHKIVAVVKKGAKVTYTGKKSGVWFQVKSGTRTGWIHSAYLRKVTTTVSSSSPATSTTVSSTKYRTTTGLNMRTGAGTQYRIVTTLKKGVTVTYTGKKSGKWFQVKYGTKTGWVSSAYLTR